MRYTGVSADAVRGIEAHHLLPIKFEDRFLELGIENIHDPRLLAWVDETKHRHWSREYNDIWELFLNTDPSADDILQKAVELAERYGYDINFQLP